MSEIYTVIVGILGILAVSGLFVGVTNDAVNFLNSAIGSKAASMKIILTVASVGIIIGVVTSSGMMEVARSGMFNPGLFTFHEVMMLYLGVMFANVILLDLYNSWGLPTSTTVSLIFCLLGAAIAVSIYKISNDPEQSVSSLGHYINTSRAMGIVSAILLSVVIAFTCGTLVMYVSRMIFSFRYTALFRRYGSLWCGASLTAIVYFAVFKGLKSILADHAFIQLIDNHLPSAIAICWVVCSLLLFFIQRFKVNILRITILSGTFALALAFAGNDLVNFIGVPVAGFDAYTIAREAGDTQMLMGALLADDRPRSPQRQRRHRARSPETPPGEHFAPFRIRGRGTQRRALRHDPRHGQPDHFGAADRHGHLAQTPAVDHLRLLHGGDGFVARRPRVGTRKRRVPHFGRYDRRGRVVHHRAGRIPDRLRGGAGADLRRDPGLHRHHAVVRVHAHPQQFPEKEQGERHRQGA